MDRFKTRLDSAPRVNSALVISLILILGFFSLKLMAEPLGGSLGPKLRSAQWTPYGGGFPAPWPFPWAKECPPHWSQLEGRFRLSGVEKNDLGFGEINILIKVVRQLSFKFVHISHYASSGQLLAEGMNILPRNQQMIRVIMIPMVEDGEVMRAILRMHYADENKVCDSTLVPIMTLEPVFQQGPHPIQGAQYRLIPVETVPGD